MAGNNNNSFSKKEPLTLTQQSRNINYSNKYFYNAISPSQSPNTKLGEKKAKNILDFNKSQNSSANHSLNGSYANGMVSSSSVN